MRAILYLLIITSLSGCGTGSKKEGAAVANSSDALLAVHGCNNSVECAVVIGAATALVETAKIIGGKPAPAPVVKDAKEGQLVLKCYMKDDETDFLYPCGSYQVFYKSKNSEEFKQLRSRGESTEIPSFPETGDVKLQIDSCQKTQELREVRAGSVVYFQFSSACST